VLGAGALSCFGAAELSYLVALGLALRRPGKVEGFVKGAEESFAAVPASLAACRVIAQLDPLVRGSHPLKVDVATVLTQSEAFEGIAKRALQLV
jgi:hypothetical protein